MASSNSRTISLKFTGDIADLVAAVGGADASLKGLNKSAGDTSGYDKLRADAEKLGYTLKQAPDTSGLDKLRADAKKLGVDLEKIGDDDGKSFGEKLFNGMADGIEKMPLLPGLIGAAILVGLPAAAGAGAAIGAAAIIAAGVAMQRNNPAIITAWNQFTTTAKDEATQASAVMVGPISDALGSLTGLMKADKPIIDDLFQGAADDIPIFKNGLESLSQNALPGFQHMISNSGPIVEGFSSLLGDAGDSLGQIFDTISADAPEIENSLKNIGNFVDQDVTPAIKGLINVSSGLGQAWTEVVAYGSAFTDILGGKGMTAATNDLNYNLGNTRGEVRYFGTDVANQAGPVTGLQTAINELGAGLVQSKGDSQEFDDAIKTLGDNTNDTKTDVQAFNTVLVGMGQSGKEQALSFIAAATEDIDQMGNSFKKMKDKALNADGTINQFTVSGGALQKQMQSAQTDIGSVAESMEKAGYSTGDIRNAVNQLDTSIEQNLHKSLGLSVTDVQKLLTQFGLMPDQIVTTLKATDGATPKVKDVQNEKIPDKWFSLFGDAGPATNTIGGVVNRGIPDKWFSLFADGGPASASIGGVINRNIPNKAFSIFGDSSPAQQSVNNFIANNDGKSVTIHLNGVWATFGTPVPGKAVGGPVVAGRPYLVGEEGPELIVPDSSGNVLTNKQTQSALSGASGGDLYLTLDLGEGITQRMKIENRKLKQRVRAGATR